MSLTIFLQEGIRMYRRLRRVRKKGFRRYEGDDQEICRKIIDACWEKEKKYFRVSGGHFEGFYSRDFSWVAGPLIRLGYREQVQETLRYALETFRKEGRIRVAIDRKGRPFDFPKEAIDSVPSIVRALRECGDEALIKKHQRFIEQEAKRLFCTSFDKQTGLVRSDRHYSSIRDHAKRKGTCYDNAMLAMLSGDLDTLGFGNPFQIYGLKEKTLRTFWDGKKFRETETSDDISAEALIFPFWCGLTKDPGHFRSVMKAIREEGLDSPFPLKYQSHRKGKMNIYSLLAPDYETDSVWAHLGLIYLNLLSRYDQGEAKRVLRLYEERIKSYGTFLEVYDRDGKPYSSKGYITDESMIWCAIYLEQKKKLKP